MNAGIDYLRSLPRLAPVRYQYIQLVADGHSYDEIAEMRCVVHGTVKNEMKRMFIQTGARNRTHLIHMAHEAGIL